jgi:hypothetical protein
MKNLFVFTLALILSFSIFSCGNEANSTQESTTAPTETKAADNHHEHDHAGHSHDTSEVAKPSPISPYIGVWKPFASSKKGIFKDNRWIEFYADGTFINGANGKETNNGKWAIDGETNYMTIDYDDNSKIPDEHWKAQLHSPVVVLIGNTDKTKTGEQIKMDKVENRPGFEQ